MHLNKLSPLMAITAVTALAASGCGSSASSTHSTASPVPTDTATQTTPATTTTPSSSSTTSSTNSTTTPATGGAAAPSGAGASATASGLSGATAVVARLGYTVANPADYHAGQTLKVLVGVRRGSADARVQRAFFFVNDRYLGTDTSDTSASIGVVSQDDTGVALRYGIYKHGQPLCCPSSTANVRYVLDNGHLFPSGQIPTAADRNGG